MPWACACSVMSDSIMLWTVAHQNPASMGFPSQECWNGLSFPLPGDLPNPGIKPMFLASIALAGGFFTTVPPGKPAGREKNEKTHKDSLRNL